MKHPLKFVQTKGPLAEALGLEAADCREIEELVAKFVAEKRSTRELFEAIGDLDISDELWANFLYTFGWWQGRL